MRRSLPASSGDNFAMKMLSYIETMTGVGREERVDIPTAIVLCKADHCPESFDGLRLSCCCFAILIDTGSKPFSQVVQQSGRPHGP